MPDGQGPAEQTGAEQPAAEQPAAGAQHFDAPAGFTTDSADSWHRVHPISPLVKGWIAIVAVVFIFGRNALESSFRGEGTGDIPPLFLGLGIGALVIVLGVGFYLSWLFTRYQVTDREVRLNTGVIFKQQRHARIDRVQAIDVVQPLLARVFGLAELKFDVADAGKSAFKLSYLRLSEAKRLRAAILARAAGVSVDPQSPHEVIEAPEREVVSIGAGRIIAAAFVSSGPVIFILSLGAAAYIYHLTQSMAAIFAMLPAVIGAFSIVWQRLVTDFNFKVAISADGVRLHYGMLETRSQTIPPGRVQAVGISQGPLQRIFGWYKVNVNVAGFGDATNAKESNRSVILPVGKLPEVMTVLQLIFPDPGVENPFEVFEAGLKGPGNRQGFVHSPRSAIFIDPLSWRYNAFRATKTALLCRHGIIFRRLEVVPHERTQSLSLYQGPLMAMFGLVDFQLHSTVGPLRPTVRHMALKTGLELFDEQAERAATARRIHNKEHWLENSAPVPSQEQIHGE